MFASQSYNLVCDYSVYHLWRAFSVSVTVYLFFVCLFVCLYMFCLFSMDRKKRSIQLTSKQFSNFDFSERLKLNQMQRVNIVNIFSIFVFENQNFTRYRHFKMTIPIPPMMPCV